MTYCNLIQTISVPKQQAPDTCVQTNLCPGQHFLRATLTCLFLKLLIKGFILRGNHTIELTSGYTAGYYTALSPKIPHLYVWTGHLHVFHSIYFKIFVYLLNGLYLLTSNLIIYIIWIYFYFVLTLRIFF